MENCNFILVAAILIFCCYTVDAQTSPNDIVPIITPKNTNCLKVCIPISTTQQFTCSNTYNIPYDVSVGSIGGVNDMHVVFRDKGYKTCRFAFCCNTKEDYEKHKIATEIDEFLSVGMGAQDGEFPHQVYLTSRIANGRSWNCGGTIYNKHHIITANHCVRYLIDETDKTEKEKTFKPQEVTVTAGVTDLEEAKPENMYAVAEVLEHPDYINASFIGAGSDIAVLRLKGNGLDFSNPKIRALRIAAANFVPDYKRNGIFSGWGLTERNESINYLLKGSIPVHHPNTCQRIADRENSYFFPHNHHICAGGADSGQTVGQGDSGGALICPDEKNRPIHCGIASYKQCYLKCIYPSVFTKVSAFTNNFIAIATKNEPQDENTIHNGVIAPTIVPELSPEYLVQIYGGYKDCAGVLVAPQIVLTSASCLYDNNFRVTVIQASTRKYIPILNQGTYPGYAEVKSDNVTKLLQDTVRKLDIGYLVLNETINISSYPKIGSTNWKDGFEDAWPANGPVLERRFYNPVLKSKCQHSYKFLQITLSPDQLCVAEKYSGSSSCDRSLGSPLMCGDSICGIASFRGCKYTFPNIYSDVTHLSDNIKSHVKYYENQIEEQKKKRQRTG